MHPTPTPPTSPEDRQQRVLLVDDERSIRITLREFLRDEGFEVTLAEDVAQAKEALQARHYDIVISDILLPQESGVSLLQFVHQTSPKTQVIMITGQPSVETATEAIRAGAFDYLIKPVKQSNIRKVVHAAARAKALLDEKERLEIENRQQQERLETLVKALQSSNQDLESFAYSVSHDLRAPLRAIIGLSDILLGDFCQDLPEEALHFLQLIQQNTTRMNELISVLLSFSRLGRQALSFETIEPNILVKQALNTLEDKMKDRQISLRIDDLPACLGDPALLQQVFFNLIQNALKFTRACDPSTLHIGSRVEDERVVYFIRDDGVGFDMRYADKLFQVFQRLHPETEYEGSGAGLAIVQRIIKRHDGELWAEAQPQQGATFYFSLQQAPP